MESDKVKQETKDMITSYLKTNLAPLLLENISPEAFEQAVLVGANCGIEGLNGHYEGIKFVPPNWYKKLIDAPSKLLVICNIDDIPKEEQDRWIEVLKYRKVSTFELPQDTRIILLVKKIDNFSSNIMSLVVMIKGDKNG